MYREKGHSLQREQGAKAIRFKQNLIFFIFIGCVLGIICVLSVDFATGCAVFTGAFLISLILNYKKTAIVFAFILLSFLRCYGFAPTQQQITNAKSFHIAVNKSATIYEFPFQDELDDIRAIPKNVLGDRGAYVAGVLFGDKRGIESGTTKAFRTAGISHILAVSGLHAGVVMGAVCFILKGVKRKVRLPILYCFLILLVVLSGFTPSVLRAGIMMGIFLIADTFGFRYNLQNSLFTAGTIILLAVPYTLFNVGFLLSFTATLGIGLFYPHLSYHLSKYGDYIGSGIAMYVACQAVALPIAMYVFGEISLMGLFGNLFTVPIVSFALISGMLGIMLYPLGLGYYPLSFSAAFMEIIEYIAAVISEVSFSTVLIGELSIIVIIIYYIIVCLMCIFAFKNRKPLYGALAVVMLFMLMANGRF